MQHYLLFITKHPAWGMRLLICLKVAFFPSADVTRMFYQKYLYLTHHILHRKARQHTFVSVVLCITPLHVEAWLNSFVTSQNRALHFLCHVKHKSLAFYHWERRTSNKDTSYKAPFKSRPLNTNVTIFCLRYYKWWVLKCLTNSI